MREKEAVENEHKHLARTNEKLLKHISNLTDVEKAITNRLVSAGMDTCHELELILMNRT
jgi:hypothetical protein